MQPNDDNRKNIAIAAALLAGIAEVAIAIWLVTLDEPRPFTSPFELAAEAVLIFLCAWGLMRHSRAAIVVLFLTFSLGVLQASALSGRWWVPVIPFTFLLLTLQAVPPIWRLQSKGKTTRSPLISAVGTTIGLVGLAGILWFARDIALTPPTRILPATQIPSAYFERLVELGALGAPREKILYFYSPVFGRFDSEFYLLTNEHVVSYSVAWINPLVRIPYHDIIDVETFYSETWVEDSVVYVTSESGAEVAIPLSSEAGGDSRFVRELKSQWVENGGSLARRDRD